MNEEQKAAMFDLIWQVANGVWKLFLFYCVCHVLAEWIN